MSNKFLKSDFFRRLKKLKIPKIISILFFQITQFWAQLIGIIYLAYKQPEMDFGNTFSLVVSFGSIMFFILNNHIIALWKFNINTLIEIQKVYDNQATQNKINNDAYEYIQNLKKNNNLK
jgi:hypothetical protein